MRTKTLALATLFSAVLLAGPASAEFHRHYFSIVGSSTIEPFAKAVGERVVKARKIQTPLLQSTGTGGGIKLFCEGLGVEAPDIVIASRTMKPKEKDECRNHGVSDVLELKIGYDGLVLAQANSAPPLKLTRSETRLATAKWIADDSGSPVLNPHKTWKSVNPVFPDSRIVILGPPAFSGTYDAFVDMISERDCRVAPWIAPGQKDPTAAMWDKCRTVRQDGTYVEGRENDEGSVVRLGSDPSAVAILDYKLIMDNAKHLRAIPIDGVEPTYENIASKTYPGTRPLFLYVKKEKLDQIPGLKEYIGEFTSERAWGEKGYLKPLGLIPMLASERATYVAEVKSLGITPVAGGAEVISGKASKTKAAKGKKTAAKSASGHATKDKKH